MGAPAARGADRRTAAARVGPEKGRLIAPLSQMKQELKSNQALGPR